MPPIYRARHRRRLNFKIRETLALRRMAPPAPPRPAADAGAEAPDTPTVSEAE